MEDILKSTGMSVDILSIQKTLRNLRSVKQDEPDSSPDEKIVNTSTTSVPIGRSYHDVCIDKEKLYNDVLRNFNQQIFISSDQVDNRKIHIAVTKNRNITQRPDITKDNSYDKTNEPDTSLTMLEYEENIQPEQEHAPQNHDEENRQEIVNMKPKGQALLNDSIIKYIKPAIPKDIMRNKSYVNISQENFNDKIPYMQNIPKGDKDIGITEIKFALC